MSGVSYRATTVVAAVAAAFCLSACTGSSNATPSPSSSSRPAGLTPQPADALRCPARVHASEKPHNVDPPTDRLVADGPTAGKVCRYYPLLGLSGRGVPHGTLYGAADVDAGTAIRLGADLNAIPRDTSFPHSCPAAFGAIDLLL